jgi:hypothetical protein
MEDQDILIDQPQRPCRVSYISGSSFSVFTLKYQCLPDPQGSESISDRRAAGNLSNYVM